MKQPPVLMRVEIRGEERKFRLWLPLFLLVPLVLLLVIILLPVILVAIVIVRVTGRRRRLPLIARTSLGLLCSMRGIRAACDVLCAMPGLRVDVCNSKEHVYVSVI
jgi:hypothetical protein